MSGSTRYVYARPRLSVRGRGQLSARAWQRLEVSAARGGFVRAAKQVGFARLSEVTRQRVDQLLAIGCQLGIVPESAPRKCREVA